MIPTSWDQTGACRCSGSLRKINPFRRLLSIPASVLTSETMIKSNIDLEKAISGWVCFKKNITRVPSVSYTNEDIFGFHSYCHNKMQLKPLIKEE